MSKQNKIPIIRRFFYLVEDVKVPFIFILAHDSGFFQQEVGDLPSVWLSSSTKLDLKVFALSIEPALLTVMEHRFACCKFIKLSCIYLSVKRTKRLELLLRTVFALPKASSRGFDCRIISFTC